MAKRTTTTTAQRAGLAELAERLGQTRHIGVDEAGRGCLAGPVVAGAVLAGPGFDFAAAFPGLTDSKALSQKKRERLGAAIAASPLHWSLGAAWPAEIDEINILNATFRAMSRAVMSLLARLERVNPALYAALSAEAGGCTLCLDGSQAIPLPQWRAALAGRACGLPPQKTLVKGDSLLPSISAASVLAKTWRDRLMLAFERRYSGYGFAAHKGYGTSEHLETLRRLGPCPQHRRTFAGVEPERARNAARREQFSLF